jgi:hypothetical protein
MTILQADLAAALEEAIRAEDSRLQEAPLVLEQQEVHGPPALCRWPLERLQEPYGAGTGPVGQGEHP